MPGILDGRKILLGITGSIAAYKSVILLRLLTNAGAKVKVIMTPSAKEFVGVMSFSTLSKNPVLSNLMDDQQWAQHVHLGQWADLLLIAPASANTLSKMAHGIVDNLLTAVYLSAKCRVMIAPAMDLDMWQHPANQDNIIRLKSFGNIVLEVSDGPLASGLTGPGRLAEPPEIFEEVLKFLNPAQPLKGKRLLVTAGPTYEQIDPVRFIGNYSSGKMGIRLAEEALKMGAEVKLVIGPVKENLPINPQLEVQKVRSAAEMFDAVFSKSNQTDIFILAAAVADFTPEIVAKEKIKKGNNDNMVLKLKTTKDIALHIGSNKNEKQFLCGFALETQQLVENAKEKLINKKMDMVVINSPKEEGAAFDHDTNKIMILDKSGKLVSFELKSKKEAAVNILEAIIERTQA